ncbi:TYRO protein tyrosine kinase-binding protein [Lissotriton helveticus]
MARGRDAAFTCLLLCVLCACGGVQGQKDCTECLQMNIGTIAGIVIGDIIVTMLIALAVFFLASKINKKPQKSGGGVNSQKMNPTYAEGIEPTYQELQDHRSDVYSDLSHK